jgi:hypothetical protein
MRAIISSYNEAVGGVNDSVAARRGRVVPDIKSLL